MTFDPMQDVPTTDEEVKQAFSIYDEILRAALWGIYQVGRAEGKSLLIAYKEALEAWLKANTVAP